MIAINILIILITSTADAIMDTISSHFPISIFSNVKDWKTLKNWKLCNRIKLYNWLNPYYSWRNKWQLVNSKIIDNNEKPWYYLGLIKPRYKERFPFSSTIVVCITDAWHFYQSIQLNLFFVFAWFAYNPNLTKLENLYYFIGYRILYGIWFTLLNDYVLIKKKL